MNNRRYVIDLIKILSSLGYTYFPQIYVPKTQGCNAAKHGTQREVAVDSVQISTLDALQRQRR